MEARQISAASWMSSVERRSRDDVRPVGRRNAVGGSAGSGSLRPEADAAHESLGCVYCVHHSATVRAVACTPARAAI